MTIIERIQREFQGIAVMIAAIVDAFKAVRAYNRALKDMEALKSKDPIDAWILSVTQHSALSYLDALIVYEYLVDQSEAFKKNRKAVTGFVIEMGSCGHTADMIISFLEQIDIDLDCWVRDKLSMSL